MCSCCNSRQYTQPFKNVTANQKEILLPFSRISTQAINVKKIFHENILKGKGEKFDQNGEG